MSEEIIQRMIEVKLKEADDFLKVRETAIARNPRAKVIGVNPIVGS